MKKILFALSFVSLSFVAFAAKKSDKRVKQKTKIVYCHAEIVKYPHHVECPNGGGMSVDYTVSVRILHCSGQEDKITNITTNYVRPSQVCR
jgi:hypothetical protein